MLPLFIFPSLFFRFLTFTLIFPSPRNVQSNLATGSGNAVSSPVGPGAEPRPKTQFSVIRAQGAHLVTLNVVLFWWLESKNWCKCGFLLNSTRDIYFIKFYFWGILTPKTSPVTVLWICIYRLTAAVMTLVWLNVETEIGAISATRTQKRSNNDRMHRQIEIIRG